jgi:hypothetical protein
MADENKKSTTYYVLSYLLFISLSFLGLSIVNLFGYNIILHSVTILVSGIIFVIILYLTKQYQKDNFRFELTPEKHCDGGPYMYSSDPVKKAYCSQFTPSQLAEYQCCKGFHGRPVHWNRTDMSDSKWENKMCDSNFNDYSDPKVL